MYHTLRSSACWLLRTQRCHRLNGSSTRLTRQGLLACIVWLWWWRGGGGGGMQSPDDLVICIQCLLVIRMWKCSTTKNPVAFYHRHRHHHKIMPNAESDHYFSVSTMELLRSIWFSIDIKVFRKVFGSESSLRFFVNVLLWFKKLSDSALQCWERSHVNHLYYRANRAIGILRQ